MKRSVVLVLVAIPVVMVACALSGSGDDKVSFALQRTLVSSLTNDVKQIGSWWQEAQSPDQQLTRNHVHPESPERSAREVWKEVQAQVVEVERHGWITDKGLLAQWQRDVKQPMIDLGREFERKDTAPRLTAAAFKRLRNELQQDLSTGQSVRALERFKKVASHTAVLPTDPRYPLRIEVENLVRRATVQSEFAAMPLEITGVIHNEAGKSGVLLNGKTYMVGDSINDSLSIKAIDRSKIEFNYKGQTFARPW